MTVSKQIMRNEINTTYFFITIIHYEIKYALIKKNCFRENKNAVNFYNQNYN